MEKIKVNAWLSRFSNLAFKSSLLLLFSFLFLLLNTFNVSAQVNPNNYAVQGTVTNEERQPLVQATIKVKDSDNTVLSNIEGNFIIAVTSMRDSLVITYVGYKPLTVLAESADKAVIILEPDLAAQDMNEVVVVGFGTQKKNSMVSSITTVRADEIKGPTSNLTNMLAGKVSGMIAYQRSGEPGADISEFYIRGISSFGSGKVDPLILIDGIESSNRDLARLQPDDISTFSVLKDATASSVYGARGANGVILVTTKSGVAGKTKFDIRAEQRISSNTKNLNFADNITYMNLANEAALTRDPLAGILYSKEKIEKTAIGADPYLYPSNNWVNMLIKPYTYNQSYNLNLSGGADIAKYYVAGTYTRDNGVLNVDKINNFNNNIRLNNYSVRTNVNLNLTKNTEGIIRVYAQFDDYNGPLGGGSHIFNQALWANPVMFPAYYPKEYSPYADHILFGNALIPGSTSLLFVNPYATAVRGYSERKNTNVMAQFELKQKLDVLTKGLSARVMAYTKRFSEFSISRQYNPFFYSASISPVDESLQIKVFNDGGPGSVGTPGTEYLNYSEGPKYVSTMVYTEGALNYIRDFNKHNVTGMLVGLLQNSFDGSPGSLEASLPRRNMSLSGRFTYGYDRRYLAEFNFGYLGSERFSEKNRLGFFPSLGVGWVVSNESFFENLRSSINNLKFRATYGSTGNDQIGNLNDRFFYMSRVNMNDWSKYYSFGEEFKYSRPGIMVSRYPNEEIGWEIQKEINLGMDLGLFNSFNLVTDIYKRTRSNILQSRSYIPTTMGLHAAVMANIGKTESKGIDVEANYHKNFSDNFWIQAKGTCTYATNKIITYDEPKWSDNEYYRYRVGSSTSQLYGYLAERLFVDEREVANSPKQFGEYMGGDIKYRDMNGDGSITDADVVPIGLPRAPEIIYGFGNSMGYKNFDFSFFFQGAGRTSFFISPGNMAPFIIHDGYQNGLLNVIAADHWSEENRNLYAFWPRLSDYLITNNNRNSTWWLRKGSFLRLKQVEIGYKMPQKTLKRFTLRNLRVYANTLNPYVFSSFKMWDPEMGGNGLGYPIQSVYNIGLQVSF